MLNESPARPKRHEKDGDQQPNLLKSLAHRRGFEPRTPRFVEWAIGDTARHRETPRDTQTALNILYLLNFLRFACLFMP